MQKPEIEEFAAALVCVPDADIQKVLRAAITIHPAAETVIDAAFRMLACPAMIATKMDWVWTYWLQQVPLNGALEMVVVTWLDYGFVPRDKVLRILVDKHCAWFWRNHSHKTSIVCRTCGMSVPGQLAGPHAAGHAVCSQPWRLVPRTSVLLPFTRQQWLLACAATWCYIHQNLLTTHKPCTTREQWLEYLRNI